MDLSALKHSKTFQLLVSMMTLVGFVLVCFGLTLTSINEKGMPTNYTQYNKTQCEYTFDLPDAYVLNICNSNNDITLNLGDTISQSWITLSARQWDYLYRISHLVNGRMKKYAHSI